MDTRKTPPTDNTPAASDNPQPRSDAPGDERNVTAMVDEDNDITNLEGFDETVTD